jgi:oxaloacetate decarboxylase alpha subunit
MTDIRLVDVSIRDGNQSLWGATGLATRQILQIAPILDRVGFAAIDFTSSSHMAVAVRYFREDPWERMRLMRQTTPRTPLQFITTGLRFISWETADADFMRLVYRRLVANGIRRMIILDPMHDREALLEAARIARAEGIEDIMAALTYTLSEVHDDAFYADLAGHLAASADIDRLYLKDPAGLLAPERARTILPAIRARIGSKPLEIHAHCTIGLGPLASLAAADLGVSIVHVGIGPLGNGSSLPAAERMIQNLRAHGHSVDIDERQLARVSEYFSALAAAEGLPVGTPQEYDAAFLRHQIAGGVMTTLQRQLAELGLAERLPAVIGEVEQVRRELGFPIMVTPFPQIVCTQAMFNVVGGVRYGQVPDQVIRYVLGRFGRPTQPVDAGIEARILDRPRAREIAAEPATVSLDELRRRIGTGYSDDEFLLRAVMPADQVDAMRAAAPALRHYNPELAPALKLLKELAARSPPRRLYVEQPGFRLQLKSRLASA